MALLGGGARTDRGSGGGGRLEGAWGGGGETVEQRFRGWPVDVPGILNGALCAPSLNLMSRATLQIICFCSTLAPIGSLY